MHAGQPGHQALHGVVRAGHPVQHLGHRQAHGEQDAVQHAQHQHPAQGAEGEQQLAAAEPGQPAESAEVDQPGRGVHHDRAQAADGNNVSSGLANSSVATTSSSVTREYSWVRAPAASASAVRLPLLLTGNPPTRPAPTLTTPSATNSWLASIRPPSRAAKDRAVRMVSV